MKKEIALILGSLLLIGLSCGTYAMVGVSPGSYEINFEPNLEKDFKFNFMFDEGVKSEVYSSGDLADYVILDKKALTGGGIVTASLKLPEDIAIPGTHVIAIGSKQIAEDPQGVMLVGNVMGQIRIKVPYPGKYAEIQLETMNVNIGDPLYFKVTVNNLGKESINAHTSIEIYDSQGKSIETLDLGYKNIETTKSEEFVKLLNTSEYKSGNYRAKAIVDYGGENTAETESSFKLGKLYVGISNYTKELERNKINKFEIEIESFWNDPIKDIHANVNIVNYSLNFLTPSMDLEPWSKIVLTGFFDTSSIKEDNFQADIALSYNGENTDKLVDLHFKKETNYTVYLIVGGVALVILALVITILILLKRIKKNGKRKKR